MSEAVMSSSHQYLTFVLDGEIYALNTETVREVLELTPITKIPRTPDFMRGVLNLRGHAVPVVDLRLKFGMEKAEDTVNTCVIIVEVDFEGEPTQMGALVDAVREVIEMGEEQIEPAPRMGTSIRTEFIKGMGRQNDDFIIILDIDRVFSAQELALVHGHQDEEGLFE